MLRPHARLAARFAALALIPGAAALAPARANATTYTGTETIGSATAALTVVTDGATGPLQQSDILDVQAVLNDQYGTATIDSATGYLTYIGGDYLSATPTTLSYEVTTGFSALDVGTGTGNLPFFCIGGFCGDPTYVNGQQPGLSFDTKGATEPTTAAEVFTGDVQIATLAPIVSGTPEPSTWGLMIAGIGGIGLALRRRQVAASPTA
jgi:hypothetical protein